MKPTSMALPFPVCNSHTKLFLHNSHSHRSYIWEKKKNLQEKDIKAKRKTKHCTKQIDKKVLTDGVESKKQVRTLPSVSSALNMGVATFLVFATLWLTAWDLEGSIGRDFWHYKLKLWNKWVFKKFQTMKSVSKRKHFLYTKCHSLPWV